MTVFTHNGQSNKARVAFAAPFPGTILPFHLAEMGGELIAQKDSFLCAAKGVSIGIHFQRKIMTGMFGGEGFIMQKLQGDGWAFVHGGGCIIERELGPGEELHVDTGCVAAMSPTVDFDIVRSGSVKSIVFGGEGLFFAKLRGPADLPVSLGVVGPAVPGVGMAPRDGQGAGAAGPAHPDRRMGPLHGPGMQRGVLQPVAAAPERHVILREEPPQDLHALLQAVHPLAHRRERDAVRPMLGLVPGGAHRALHPPLREVVERDHLGREHRGPAMGHPGHHRPQADRRGLPGEPRQERPGLEVRALGIADQREEVVADPDALDPQVLGHQRPVHEVVEAQMMLLGLEPETHGRSLRVVADGVRAGVYAP